MAYYKANLLSKGGFTKIQSPSQETIGALTWKSMSTIVDEIACAAFDGRGNFSLTKEEADLVGHYIRDKFYVKDFGAETKDAAKLGSAELRRFISEKFDQSAQN